MITKGKKRKLSSWSERFLWSRKRRSQTGRNPRSEYRAIRRGQHGPGVWRQKTGRRWGKLESGKGFFQVVSYMCLFLGARKRVKWLVITYKGGGGEGTKE